MKRLEFRPATPEAMRADYDANLSKGRAFVPGASGLAEREACTLVVVHPQGGSSLELRAEVVWIAPNGVGLAIIGMDLARKAEVTQFIMESAAAAPEPGAGSKEPAAGGSEGESGAPARNIHERVRALSTREREELARQGPMPERVALERAFGGAIWELLLQNPQISAQEIAKIAKNASLPRPLVATIVANGAWVASAEVQRALLSNLRCTGAHLDKVLASMKPAELERLALNCPYRPEVRSAAARLSKK